MNPEAEARPQIDVFLTAAGAAARSDPPTTSASHFSMI
jgi:hypothetical protein